MVAQLAALGISIAANVAGKIADSAQKGAAAEKTRKTAEDFETMFLEQSLERLTESAGEDGPLGDNGTGGSVYRSMLSKEHARSIVKSGGLGIADAVYRQMLQMQEGASGAGAS